MVSLRLGLTGERWWLRGAVIAVALLTLATSLCLLDQDEHGARGGMAPSDLCLVMLIVPLVVMLFAGLLRAGAAAEFRLPARDAVVVGVPAPPPKLPSLR